MATTKEEGRAANWPYASWKPSGWLPEEEPEVKPETPHPHGGDYQAGCLKCQAYNRLKRRRLREGR